MTYRQAFSAFYARSFERRPWVTLAVTNGILGVVADSVAQGFERVQAKRAAAKASIEKGTTIAPEHKDWDFARNGRFLAFNVAGAPLLAEWNKFIEYRFPLRSTAAAGAGAAVAGAAQNLGKVSALALAKRVATDQLIFAPFGLAMFVGGMGYMERGTLQGTKDKFSEMYMSALIANWQIWPLVQLVNFRYMPLKYRVPFVSTIGILWNIGLSLLSQSRRTDQKPIEAAPEKASTVSV